MSVLQTIKFQVMLFCFLLILACGPVFLEVTMENKDFFIDQRMSYMLFFLHRILHISKLFGCILYLHCFFESLISGFNTLKMKIFFHCLFTFKEA